MKFPLKPAKGNQFPLALRGELRGEFADEGLTGGERRRRETREVRLAVRWGDSPAASTVPLEDSSNPFRSGRAREARVR